MKTTVESAQGRKKCNGGFRQHFFKNRRNFVIRLALLVILLAVLPLSGLYFADPLLVTRQEPCTADVIVVLGGENESRTEKAVELYALGYAPRIIVTGKNEAELIGRSLVTAGVPKEFIAFEPSAVNTFENASFSMPILKERNVKTVLLVTSWFHSRRASSIFRSCVGNIKIISVPTTTDPSGVLIANKWLRKQVLLEYVKTLGYWPRYGISPFKDLSFNNYLQEKKFNEKSSHYRNHRTGRVLSC
ncbi:MAG: YdcF family protein [Desulfuromonadales bacterium]